MQGKVLQQIIELGSKDEVHIVITEIVKQEVKSRIQKSLEKAKLHINQVKKEGRAASINPDHGPLMKLNVDDEAQRIFEQFENFIKHGKVSVIPYSPVSIAEIFKSYFETTPPFGRKEDKKHEFPDAFSLALLENWVKEKRTKCFTISRDNDIINYNSDFLFNIKDPAKYLDGKAREVKEKDNKNAIKLIERSIDVHKDEIVQEISITLITRVEEDYTFSEYEGKSIDEVENANVKDLEIDELLIISYSWDGGQKDVLRALIELHISFTVTAELGYDNLDYAYWDSEDQKYYNVEHETLEIEQWESSKVIVEVDFTILNGEPRLFNFDIREIDSIVLDEEEDH